MKLKFKFLITTFILSLLLLSSFSFASNDIMLISETTENVQTQKAINIDSDLYIANESEYEIKDIKNGNVYVAVDTLNINPINNGGIIQGNLFVSADNVNIKSDVVYSDNQKDDLGNPTITINKSSSISGNVFVIAKKFVLEPGCEINGDLYLCADEIILNQKSKINGNIFACATNFELNAEVGGNLYATANSFDMKYYGFIFRDLHLNTEEATLNGWVYRNSFITAKNITTESNFINEKDFNVEDADNLVFSGKISGNANINSKNISFKNIDNDKNLTCKISGNLSYSSNVETEIPEGIVTKEISYSNYKSTSSSNNIWDYLLSLIALLVCVYVIYIIISKFTPKFLDKFSNISGLNLLKYLGIGLGFLILIPIVSILLIITSVGSILGIILLLIYIILLIIAKPIFIISVAKFVKNKLSFKFNIYLYILAITIILSLIDLIPVVGFIISLLISLTGFGMIVKRWNFLDGLFYFSF